MAEPIAVAVHLEDVDVVGQPIEQCAGQAFGAEGFGPLVEWQVAGDHRGTALIALRDQLEQQFGAGFAERDEAQFVDDQQFDLGQLALQAKQALLVSGSVVR